MAEDDISIVTGKKKLFTTVDYVLFGLTLAVSAGIGLFYAIKDRNKLDSKTFMLGEKKMSVFPVAMSLLVTFLSALTLLGTPVEMYNYTTMYWWLCLAFLLATLIVARVFIPFFYELNMTSVFEYLEMRFSKPVRVLASILFIIQTSVYMSFVLYAPSLALNAVTGFDLWTSLISVGVVVTLYTALGGMKAVVWTDTFQAGVIIAGLLAVLIQGSIKMGGFQNAWDIAGNRSRIYFHDFDPSTRHSFWSVVIGGGFFWMSLYGVNQAQVQRAVSCPNVFRAQLAVYINLPGFVFVVSTLCMIGIVMYAFYADCHPLKFNGLLTKTDQLLPLFVMDILGHLPGIPGVFVSCVFSGSLSTISSGLNALGAVIPHDLIQPYCCKNMSDRALTFLSKFIILLFGGIGMALAYMVSQLGNVLQASYSVYSIVNGPMFGLFVLGMFFPWANAWGAFIGAITSLTFMCWIGFGALATVSPPKVYPTYTHGCNWNVTTTMMTTTTLTTTTASPAVEAATVAATGSSDPFLSMYTLSYLNYTPTAMAVLVIVGMVVSLITGKRDPGSLEPRLTCPLFDRLFPCMPEYILRPLRCGVNNGRKYVIGDELKSPYILEGADNLGAEVIVDAEKPKIDDFYQPEGPPQNVDFYQGNGELVEGNTMLEEPEFIDTRL